MANQEATPCRKIKPVDFSITLVNDSSKPFRDDGIFLTNEFGILYDMSGVIGELLKNKFAKLGDAFFFRPNQPYRLKEVRIVFLLQGQVTLRHNLIEYTIQPSQIFVLPIGSIVQIMEVAPGTLLQMIGFNPNFAPFIHKDEQINYYWSHKHYLNMPLSEKEKSIVQKYFGLIWETVQTEEFYRESVQYLLVAFLHYINDIRKEYHSVISNKLTHQDELFNRFITLVNKHGVHERNVNFYAGKLCLTPRYLNTVVRQVSGQTVMEWVNQSVILEAKILLRHDNLLIYQIADKLNFPNPSFFCKFFKRETGMTPQEYQKN